jgi:uncharacterized protein (DUF58 family)
MFMAALIAVAAVGTGNNLLYLILSLCLSAMFASGIIARLSLRSMFVSLQFPQNVFERERVSIKVSLRNQKRWIPAFSVLVEDLTLIRTRSRKLQKILRGRQASGTGARAQSPVLQHAAYFPAIPASEGRAELISQSFASRGSYAIDSVRLSTCFPFGLFQRGEFVSVRGEILVYPAIREVSSDLHLLPFLPGKFEAKRKGHGESLYAIRDYREGESARLMHWKATAKTGKLMAREHARDEESEFCLILDTLIPEHEPDPIDRFEKAVSLAASLAAHFAREGSDFEYLAPSEHVPRGTGTDHLFRILRSLAVVQCQQKERWETSRDLTDDFAGVLERDELARILSGKVFKIIITSRSREAFPAAIQKSSHVIRFDEL